MQLIRDSKVKLTQSVVTIGNFDGLHKGHQRLIETVIANASECHCPSVLLTFEPNPNEYFVREKPMARLMRFSEKWKDIQKTGIDYFYCARFNAALSKLSADDFVKTILVDQLHAKKVIVGDNFRFGAKRSGDIGVLKTLGKKYDFDVIALPQIMHLGDRISSTRVRSAVEQGDFALVQTLTGRPFTLSGKVSYGDQIGRQLGYPTANIHLHRRQVPLMGIFVVRVHGINNQVLQGVASVGYRPTFNGKKIILEVFIFDFNDMIYGKNLTVEFLSKIRDELHFESIDALIVQIENDVQVAKAYFKR